MSTSFARESEWYGANPFLRYDPLVSLVAFHASRHPRRLIRKPNQVGGTQASAWEAWAHLIGSHRWKPGLVAANGLVLVADLSNAYVEVCSKLRDTEPTWALSPETKYVEGVGYTTNGKRMIRTRIGKTMRFRSGSGDAMAAEVVTVGWLWIDEPPKQAHFSGALSRVAVAQGPVWMSFTPINRPVAYLKLHIEGDRERGIAPREEWEQFRPRLVEEDCTTAYARRVIRSAGSIQAQIAGYTRSQILQRVYGEWEGISDERAFSAFDEARHVVRQLPAEHDFDPERETKIGIGLDHGERPGAQVGVLARYQTEGRRRVVWITGECVSTAITTEVEDARAVLDMLAREPVEPGGLSLRHVDLMVGDLNSAGKSAAGHSINEILGAELSEHGGYPIEISGARKGRIIERVRILNLAFKRGELYIHPSCVGLLESIRMWDNTKSTEHFKHFCDAMSYLCVPFLDHGDIDHGVSKVELVA